MIIIVKNGVVLVFYVEGSKIGEVFVVFVV